MNPTVKLTARQQQILELIQQAIAQTGAPPTRAEIAAELGFRSANAAEEHLQALARKGVIELVGGTSRGIRLKSDILRSLRSGGTDPVDVPAPGTMSVPLVGRVAAGSPILAQEHIERSYTIEPHLFTRRPDYLLKVRGMSMRDAGILDGDLIAVHRNSEARNGQIVVARVDDDVTVKTLQRKGAVVELLPANPDYAPIVIDTRRAPVVIEGVMVGLIRKDH